MTVETEVSSIRYTGITDGVAIAAPFPVQATDEIKVYYGNNIEATEGFEYTVTLNAPDYLTADVTPLTGFAALSGGTISINRVVPYLQAVDIPDHAKIGSGRLEQICDRLTFMTQQLRDQLAASLRYPFTDAVANIGRLPVAADRALKYLAFDADGKPIASTAVLDTTPVTAFGAAWVALADAEAARVALGIQFISVDQYSGNIQAALTAAGALGKHVLLFNHGAVYETSVSYVIPSGVHMHGIGMPTIKLADNIVSLPYSMLTGTGADGAHATDVGVYGIIFDGNRENNINHGVPDGAGNQAPGWEGLPLAAISIAYTDGVKIRDCHVQNMWASGIWLLDCTDVSVENNRVTAFRSSGIDMRRIVPTTATGSTTYRVLNNYVEGGIDGIQAIFGTARGIISNNICIGCKDSAAFPAFAYLGAYPNVWPTGDGQAWTPFGGGGYVSPVNEGDGAGIELTGFYTTAGAATEQQITIDANVLHQNQIGVRVEQAASGTAITGNVCTDSDLYGIFFYSGVGGVVSGNYVARSGASGISVQKAAAQAVPTYLQILGNHVYFNDEFGISLERTTNCMIQGNFLAENRQDALSTGGAFGFFRDGVDACDRVSVKDNMVIQDGGYWVYYDNAGHASMVVSNNEFYGTPTAKTANVTAVNTTLRDNIGIVTRNKGGGTVLQNSFVDIAHGLDITPAVNNIRIFAVADAQADGRLYLGPTPGATTFAVILAGGPATLDFAWSVDDG